MSLAFIHQGEKPHPDSLDPDERKLQLQDHPPGRAVQPSVYCVFEFQVPETHVAPRSVNEGQDATAFLGVRASIKNPPSRTRLARTHVPEAGSPGGNERFVVTLHLASSSSSDD